MKLLLVEENAENFLPMALTRATFELRYGALCPLDRALLRTPDVALRCRPHLAPYLRARTGLKVNEEIERAQVERLRAVRDKRDAERAENALLKLEESARGTENLLPRILDCVENYVTVGEISNQLRKVWGEYREAVTV